jgi:hypothetical protein
MILFRQIAATARQGRVLWPLALCQLLLLVSCANRPEPAAGIHPSLQYTAASRLSRAQLPTKMFFFPPLVCDAKGKPKESLTPVQDPQRGIVDWVSPSAKSKKVRRKLEDYFRSCGNQVVSFEDVLAAETPHSILIVSSFYSAPLAVEAPKPGQADQYVLCMVKASTFGVDLDPANSRSIASIDGITFFDSTRKPSDIEGRSLESAIRWLGDNVNGVTSLDP